MKRFYLIAFLKVPFGMAGDWKITIEVRQGDTVLAAQDFVIPVQ